MRTKIKIKDTQRKITINKKLIAHLAKRILKVKAKATNTELSILFVGKQRMRTLNKKFRKIDRPTDVLSFSMHEGKGSGIWPGLLGDVVICPELAQRAARVYKTTTEKEICLYLIHGILHLFGYQDTNTKSRSRMKKEEKRLFKQIMR